MRNPRPKKSFWALFDQSGQLIDFYVSKAAAESEAWGPRFRSYTIREYRLVPRTTHPKPGGGQ